MQTQFSSHTLAEIFRDIYQSEKSGVLHLSRKDCENRIYFDRGMILFADADAPEQDLGPRLVSEGKISSGALAEARRNVSETKDLAQVLVNRGLIGKDNLSHTVTYLIEKVVRSVFKWDGGTAWFGEGHLLQEIFESDVVSTFGVILKGISGMSGFVQVRDAMKAQDSALTVTQPMVVPLERLALTPSHGFLLSRIDGNLSIREILSTLPPAEEEAACRFLYGLLVMGALKFDPPVCEGPFSIGVFIREHEDHANREVEQEKFVREEYRRIMDCNSPMEVLQVGNDVTREQVERAYIYAKEQFKRERVLSRVRENLKSELSIIENRLVEAYLALVQHRQHEAQRAASAAAAGAEVESVNADDLLVRVEMDKTKTKMAMEASGKQADQHFAKARKAKREGDYHNAIQYCKLAISYNEEDARFYFLLAECQAMNPASRWQRLAEKNFIQATELNPWEPEYWLTLGRFYKKRGLSLRARKQFEKALEIAPSHETAQEELAGLK
jgi:tetratricopeptide (TPR) repeat protein